MIMFELWDRVIFWNNADRIGPDMLSTHWMLYFKSTMLKLCIKKFRYFHNTAEFRPGAYAVGCSKISIGKRVVIRPGTMLHADTRENGAGIIIEDNVLMGSGIHIYVDTHKFDDPYTPLIDQGFYESQEVVLRNGCWIGANAIILPGVTIGENAVVGAGSIVTKDIPARTVAVGNPANVRQIFGIKNDNQT
jgi:acetyltransferase-like isoleucine patch superfamily enzyme